MPVRPTRYEHKCKCCISPHRDEINRLLEQQKKNRLEPLPNGLPTTVANLLAYMASELDFVNPTMENITLHWKKHCEYVNTEEEATAEARSMEKMLHSELGEGWEERILRHDEVMRIIFSYEAKDAFRKIATGTPLQGAQIERLTKMSNEISRQGGGDSLGDLAELVAESA